MDGAQLRDMEAKNCMEALLACFGQAARKPLDTNIATTTIAKYWKRFAMVKQYRERLAAAKAQKEAEVPVRESVSAARQRTE